MKNTYVCYMDPVAAGRNSNCLSPDGFSAEPASLEMGGVVLHRDVPEQALMVCARHLANQGQVIALFLKPRTGKRPVQSRAPLLALIASKRPLSR